MVHVVQSCSSLRRIQSTDPRTGLSPSEAPEAAHVADLQGCPLQTPHPPGGASRQGRQCTARLRQEDKREAGRHSTLSNPKMLEGKKLKLTQYPSYHRSSLLSSIYRPSVPHRRDTATGLSRSPTLPLATPRAHDTPPHALTHAHRAPYVHAHRRQAAWRCLLLPRPAASVVGPAPSLSYGPRTARRWPRSHPCSHQHIHHTLMSRWNPRIKTEIAASRG